MAAATAITSRRGNDQFRGLFTDTWAVACTLDSASVADQAAATDTVTVPGVALDVWLGVFMPAGVPRDIVTKANADIARVLQMPDIKNSLASQGIEAVTSTPEALSNIIRDDYARWGKVIREADIKAD
jgi:hypothetical protein